MAMDADAPIVEVEVAAAGQAENEELPPFDESKLIRGKKGNVLRPTRPDDVERNIQIEKLDAEIKKHMDRTNEIKALQQSMRARGPNPEQAEHRRRKDELHAAWTMTLKQKMAIREEFNRANNEREVVKNEIRETRGKIPRGTKLETLEADISAAEYRMEHESLSATDEKKAQQYIQSLVAARPLSRQILMLEEKLKMIEAARAASKVRLDNCDATLSSIKEREQVEMAALEALRKKREEETVDLPALEVEKQECWEVVQLLRAKKNEIREAFNQKWAEYQEINKNYLIWVRHDKKAQFEERQKAREAREADRVLAEGGQVAGAAPTEPYETEIFTIDMLLVYLRKFQASEDSSASKPAEETKLEIPQGCLPMKKKEEDMSFFAKVEKKPKGKGGAKDNSASSSSSGAKNGALEPPAAKGKKINHTLDILQSFMSVGLEVPSTTLDVPSSIEKMEAKRIEFLDKRKRVKEGPVAAPPTPAPATTSAPEPEPVPEPEPEPEAAEEEVPPEPASAVADAVEAEPATAEEPVVEEAKAPEEVPPPAPAPAEEKADEQAPAPAAAVVAVPAGGVSLSFAVHDEKIKLTIIAN